MGYENREPQPVLRQFGGYNVKDSEISLPGADSPFMFNVDLHPEGAIKARKGCQSLTTPESGGSPIAKIDALFRLEQPEAGIGWLYCLAGGKIYRTAEPGVWAWEEATCASPPTFLAQQSWGRASSRYYDGATEHPNVLYIPHSNGAPLIALGQTPSPTNDLILMPAGSYGSDADGTGTKGYPSAWAGGNWPTHMAIIGVGRGARLYAWGCPDNKSRIYYSEKDVPWNFMRSNVDYPSLDPQSTIDGGHFTARPGAGGEAVSVVDMFGYTVVFKRTRTLIYTSDPGFDDHQVVADLPVGCVGDRALVKVGNDIIFWSEDGPRTLSAVQEYGDIQQNNLAWKINKLVKDIETSSFERICCYHDPKNERVVWFVPLVSTSNNDSAFVYYYRTGKWSKWTGPICKMMDVLQVTANTSNQERFIGASYDSGVMQVQYGQADADSDGESINIENDYYTNWINYGNIADATRALALDAFFGEGGPMVDIYYQTDLNDSWTQISRISKAYGGVGMAWGFFAWGSAAWGTVGRTYRSYELDSLFNMIRFRFHKTGQTGWEVMAYRLEPRGRGRRA